MFLLSFKFTLCSTRNDFLIKVFYLRTDAQDFFYVSLTVHLSITLANDQLDAQFFKIRLL